MTTIWLFFSILFINLLNEGHADECLTNEQIIENLANVQKPNKQDTVMKMKYSVNDWSYLNEKNKLEVDATLELQWENSDLAFSELNPCNSKIDVSKLSNSEKKPIWYQNIEIEIPTHHHHHGRTRKVLISKNGIVIYSQRIQQHIICEPSINEYPFGNVSCSFQLNHVNSENQYEWAENTFQLTNFKTKAGSLLLKDVNVNAKELSEEQSILISFTFAQSPQDVLIHFFIPSFLFMIPPLLTLLLGPMAITRCCILMTSLILLSVHYSTTMHQFPSLDGVNSLSLWKLFSYIYVTGIVIELVLITLLSSVGRSRSCCTSRRNHGKYEMEPLYEEMNDLRQRKTRKTRNCCRMTALVFDIISFVFFGVGLILFCYLYLVGRNSIVSMINHFEMKSLYVF